MKSTASDTPPEDEPPIKKVKTTDSSSPPPLYGSQEYWDSRYREHKRLENPPKIIIATTSAASSDIKDEEKANEKAKEDALPYHAWYFTYKDLRPLILPLIIGGCVDMDLFDGESTNQYQIEEQSEQGEDDATSTSNNYVDRANEKSKKNIGDKGMPVDDANEKDDEQNDEDKGDDQKGELVDKSSAKDVDQNDEEKNDNDDVDQDGSSDKDEESSDGSVDVGEDDDEFIEIEEGDEEEYDEEPPDREGVAKNGPVSVLEVGCGDVPLGTGLAIEFIALEKDAGTKVDGLIKKIVCCDYSPTVVAMMNDNKADVEGMDSDRLATLDTILDFQTVDARKMPYEDRSFEIVLEKGTLDAMLSDKETGIENCQKIVTECARVLAIGGYIFLVSHVNAHTDSGIEWLDQVILPGLRNGDKNAKWEIEVHGNDGTEQMEKEEQDNSSLTAGSPGPGVYIIHKLEASQEGEGSVSDEPSNEPPGIPLKFFSY